MHSVLTEQSTRTAGPANQLEPVTAPVEPGRPHDASSDSPATHINLEQPIPDLQPGAWVVIDLFATGKRALYSAVLVSYQCLCDPFLDAAAALQRCVTDVSVRVLEQCTVVDTWLELIHRLLSTVYLLDHSDIESGRAIGREVEDAVLLLTTELRDGQTAHAQPFEQLTHAAERCRRLAVEIVARSRQRMLDDSAPVYAPLVEDDLSTINNRPQVIRGLALAMQLGLEELQVGFCFDNIAVRSIRGRVSNGMENNS